MKLLRIAGNLLWPPRCVFCGKFLPITVAQDACYCPECAQRLRPQEQMSCGVCSTEMVPLARHLYCPKCEPKVLHIDGLAASFYYDDDVQQSVLRYKFHKRSGYLKTYAVFMAETFYNTPKFFECTCVCAVPDWKWDAFFAGESRSRNLCSAFHKLVALPRLDGVLIKQRKTGKQKKLSANERLKNVAGAYAVTDPDRVKGQIVLLLDDVYTTGATTNECAKTLKKAGAKEVFVLTLAIRT